MLENLWFSNFELGNITNYSVLDEINSDLFSQLTNYEISVVNQPRYPTPIKSIKLIVSHANTISPTGPHEYAINSARNGNNNIQITDPNIISAFRDSLIGSVFDINVQTLYEGYDNTEVVLNKFSQYTKIN